MCKKFYVQVKGLGDDGRQLLEQYVTKESILVIDDTHRNKLILEAIYKACGVTWEEISSESRGRTHAIARVIYVWHAIKCGDTVQMVCKELGRDRTTIMWYIDHYQDSMEGDKSFARIATRVEELLVSNPDWCPRVPKTTNTERKKGKKRRKRGKKVPTPKYTREEIEAIMEKRQLKIDWEHGE